MRSSLCISHANGSASFILAVWMRVESVAHVLPPPAFPTNRLFLRLCRDLHNRKNWLFAGSDKGGERIANILTIIETAKLHGHNPETYLTDVLTRIKDYPIDRLEDLLPWNMLPAGSALHKAV